jgi:hypothetical protein
MRKPQGENGVASDLIAAFASSAFTSARLSVERRGLLQAFDQGPETVAQLGLERPHQPFGQVVAVAFEQIVGLDGVAVVEPALFGVVEGALEEVARAVKAQDRHAALLGPAARRSEMVVLELPAQHVVDGLGQRRTLALA